MGRCGRSTPGLLATLLVAAVVPVLPEPQSPGGHPLVHREETLGLALTDHAQTAVDPQTRKNPPRERPPIVYFYSRGGRQIQNRGAEVFHQLHHAVRREGIMSYIEDGVNAYATTDSQFVDDYEEISQLLGPHDNVVVTAIPHAMDEGVGALLPAFTGAPHLGNRTRVIKWQIGYSFPSISYFVDERQHMICDTFFLVQVMGCVKEAYIRAPPLDLYYHALSEAVADAHEKRATAVEGEVSTGASSPLAILKERLVLYDNDHRLDVSRLNLKRGCMLQELDGLTREQMVEAYRRAVVVIDLWLPGAETVTAEGAMFDCCILVPNEMNGANPRDFPIASHLKIGRESSGDWNYTQLSELLNRALDEYDSFIPEFRPLKEHVMALPGAFQADVHRYFANDIHFVAGAFSPVEQELVMPWAVSVLMNYPLASIDILVHNRIQFGLAWAGVFETLRQRGLKQSITVSDAREGHGGFLRHGTRIGPRAFNHAVREWSLTCFADPRSTLLRPDALALVETNSSAWNAVRDSLESAEGGSIRDEAEPQQPWVLECIHGSDFPVIPLETGWIDFNHAWRVRHWSGFFLLEEGAARTQEGAALSGENCAHLEEMYQNVVYRGVFPYFSARYRQYVRRTLERCGVASDAEWDGMWGGAGSF